MIAQILFTLLVALTSTAGLANASNVVPLGRNCGSSLLHAQPSTAAVKEVIAQYFDESQWVNFRTFKELNNSAYIALGVDPVTNPLYEFLAAEHGEESHSSARGQYESVRTFDLLVASDNAVNGGEFLHGWKMIAENMHEWTSKNAKTEQRDLGFQWDFENGVKIYLSAVFSRESEFVASEGNQDQFAKRGIRYTFGLEMACNRATKYTREKDLERIITDDGVRCRVPVMRFYGLKPLAKKNT